MRELSGNFVSAFMENVRYVRSLVVAKAEVEIKGEWEVLLLEVRLVFVLRITSSGELRDLLASPPAMKFCWKVKKGTKIDLKDIELFSRDKG